MDKVDLELKIDSVRTDYYPLVLFLRVVLFFVCMCDSIRCRKREMPYSSTLVKPAAQSFQRASFDTLFLTWGSCTFPFLRRREHATFHQASFQLGPVLTRNIIEKRKPIYNSNMRLTIVICSIIIFCNWCKTYKGDFRILFLDLGTMFLREQHEAFQRLFLATRGFLSCKNPKNEFRIKRRQM